MFSVLIYAINTFFYLTIISWGNYREQPWSI